MNKATAVLTMVAVLAAASCSNDEVMESKNIVEPDFEVSTMGQWLPATRGTNEEVASMPVLHFRDQAAYERTVEKLVNMSDEQRLSFYKTINFDGAYSQLEKARTELEKIFDIEDSLLFISEVHNYLEKYKNTYNFENEEAEDITPNLRFKSPQASLVANLDGYLAIDKKLVNANDIIVTASASSQGSDTPPSEFNVDFQKVCEFKNVHKKYRSIIYIGYDKNTKWCVAHFRSYKKIMFAEIQKKTRFFSYVTITNSTTRQTIVPKTYIFLNEGHYNFMLAPKSAFDNIFQYVYENPNEVDINIEDFYSDICPTHRGILFTNKVMYP